jgi:hypothetical protein
MTVVPSELTTEERERERERGALWCEGLLGEKGRRREREGGGHGVNKVLRSLLCSLS